MPVLFHGYILYSVLKDRYYIGYTGDELAERLRKHKAIVRDLRAEMEIRPLFMQRNLVIHQTPTPANAR